jgi:hypothetical protein
MIKIVRRPRGVVVGFLALGGVVAAATHYLYEPYNQAFWSTRPKWLCKWS